LLHRNPRTTLVSKVSFKAQRPEASSKRKPLLTNRKFGIVETILDQTIAGLKI